MILAAAVLHKLLLDVSDRVRIDADNEDDSWQMRGRDEDSSDDEDDDIPAAHQFARREELVNEMMELDDDEINLDAWEIF